ncbi:glutamine amidotransferase [Solibacillus silvestris StLB046]|uniref:Imidazole glycerol phosphate synthase subunit HisH n=1 Tax=Solibacillus silvestris (strain StLB046) TaxID=1002809 RepID=F2F053_SOLSS|nr:imidazole glycerol phosphate synthase subunit HisH [Solibacillus silvestris]BAK15163.1 glutamine amidotransferase [Solibacillus silvestris StLB046]
MKIGVIDYGMGNLFSVEQALKRLDVQVIVSSNIEQLEAADAYVLPGVGAFPDAMKRLEETGFIDFIKKTKKPLLGICLGMQLLFEESDEVEQTKGLGIFKGRIQRFTDVTRIPHMGWNELKLKQTPEWIDKEDLPQERHVYFVHSYYASGIDEMELIASADYEHVQVPGIVAKDNFTGMQFHPEKSGPFGVYLLTAWTQGVKEGVC